MDTDLQALCWAVGGAAALLAGNAKRHKYQRLAAQGQKATGLVTSVLDDSWLTVFDTSICQYSVRFITADNRWITKNYFRLVNRDERRYQEGETVDILYNPADPEEFIIGSFAPRVWAHLLMLVGSVAIGYAIWLVFWHL